MSFAGGHDWDAIQNALFSWVVSGSGIDASRVRWAQQDAPRSDEPGIVMRLSIFDDAGMPWLDHETNYYSFADIIVTTADAATNTLTKVAHGLLTGDGPVRLTGADLPLNLLENKDYWVIKVDADRFSLADTFTRAMQGSTVDFTDAGSGTITLVDTPTTLRAGQELKYLARTIVHVGLSLECHTAEGVGANMATSILNRIRARAPLPSQSAILEAANIGLRGFDRIFAVRGERDAFLYEPRASVNVQLSLPSEDSETGTMIERTIITNEITQHVYVVPPTGDGPSFSTGFSTGFMV